MPSITVRDVPTDVHEELVERAARSGRSLQEFLRAELIEMSLRPDQDALLARLREQKRPQPAAPQATLDRALAQAPGPRCQFACTSPP